MGIAYAKRSRSLDVMVTVHAAEVVNDLGRVLQPEPMAQRIDTDV